MSPPRPPTNASLRSIHPLMKKLSLTLLAAAALAGFPPRAARAALLTIDQQNTTGNGVVGSYSVSTNLAQTFTPTLTSINAATFNLELNYGNTPATVRLDLFAGQTITGTPLASSAVLTLTNSTIQTVEFDLASPALLTPNTLYTLALVQTGGAAFLAAISAANPYAGGQAYYGSTFRPSNDFIFAEGLGTAAAAPEPGTWAMLGVGVAGLGFVTLRRRRAA